ncbi:hypothetical protein [Mesorhizobium sp. CCNWLY176]|uniref:hypothetical protein n=1 Tax=Mesorhizobium sp. CCNWLY176 TaxID=3128543 RepID=UPI00301BC2A3
MKKGPPLMQPTAEPSSKVTVAAKELILEAIKESTTVYNVTLRDVSYEGVPLGTWEVTVRRTDV